MDDSQTALQQANEEIYKQNFELSIRNKTLSVLKSVYDISISSVETTEVAQKIVDTIEKELGFPLALISLWDKKGDCLKLAAINDSLKTTEAIAKTGKTRTEIIIPGSFRENLAIKALASQGVQVTTNVLDILTPLITQETANEIAEVTGVKTAMVYPLILAGEAIGVLKIGLSKGETDLSRAERETLEQLAGLITLALDRAKLYQDLRDANNQLKELDKIKDEFISVTSHELRAPMTAIKSYTWLVINNRAGELSPKAREYLDKVYVSTERLIHLVNEMLDVSRIESGRVLLRPEQFEMKLLAETVEDEFGAKAAEAGIALEVVADDNLPMVTADKEKMHQVLENLVSNAIKFTGAGKVTIAVTVKDGFLETAVRDTGAGISEEDQKKLFVKFGRLENSLIARSGSGSGLGLYICKLYVELQQGRIWFESTSGKGSTFAFALPLG